VPGNGKAAKGGGLTRGEFYGGLSQRKGLSRLLHKKPRQLAKRDRGGTRGKKF